jgi:hypothetical protein
VSAIVLGWFTPREGCHFQDVFGCFTGTPSRVAAQALGFGVFGRDVARFAINTKISG